jgi:hypothetical protein
MSNKEELNNIYAYNVRMEEIHISQAVSGRKGYYCLGCQKEMQAVLSILPNRISYFRHDHNAIKGLPKCTYSDETYRHILAKQLLIALKRVKVPTLYKYPPKGIEGVPMFISGSKFIEAEHVKAELYFFENEMGEVQWSRSISSEESKYLLLKPDIAFFDAHKKPILLIEIVVTHKITEKKQLDLKRLGIDTIQITIPKDSPENIEQTLKSTERTKWVYNYEQDNTEYIPTPNQYSEGISPTDEDQRKLLEESVKCRTAQINNLIRTITRCLESEQFGRVARNIESEISRVEESTEENRGAYEQQNERHQQHVENIRIGIRERINRKYRERREEFNAATRILEKEEEEFQRYRVKEIKEFEMDFNKKLEGIKQSTTERYRNIKESINTRYGNLEERYNRKRNELETNRESDEHVIRELTERFARNGGSIDRGKESNDRIREEKSNIEREIQGIDRLKDSVSENHIRERNYGANLEKKYTDLRDGLMERMAKKGIETEERIARKGVELEEKYTSFNNQVRESIKTRDFAGNEYTRRIKNSLADVQRIPDFINAQETFRRYEKAWECFRSGAFQHWHD